MTYFMDVSLPISKKSIDREVAVQWGCGSLACVKFMFENLHMVTF